MMEQNFKPSLFLQVVREFAGLSCKLTEDRRIADIIRSYQNEKFVEWMNEAEKVIAQTKLEIRDRTRDWNSWGKSTISRIRKLRAKGVSNFTFQRVCSSQEVGSSSILEPLSLLEELYCEIMLLINTNYYATATTLYASSIHDEFNEDLQEQIEELLEEIKLQLEEQIPETDSDWYCNKIVEARMLIAKCEPAFSLQSHDLGSSSINIPSKALPPLHEELCCEIRSLIRLKCADSMTVHFLAPDDHGLKDEFKEEVQKQKDKVDKFLTEVNLQFEEKIPKKNSDWYRNKIAEARMLIDKSYPPFPFITRDLGYIKEEYQIFLSFKGEDTRQGFTGNLYHALNQEGFNVFMDDRGLHTREPIAQVTMGAIENSKLSIIVFSENFAECPRCLDEVVKILECKENNNQLVWSVFYKVEPTEVRHQKNKYEKAMINLETRFGKDSDNVKNWRSALNQVCGYNAFHYKENNGLERDFIQDIIKDVINIRNRL